MSQLIKQEQIADGNGEDIRSIEGSERILETISGTIGDGNGNTQGNGGNSTNVLLKNLLGCHCHRVPLPLELNCQIFECLKFGIQRKFIGGLGRGIYGIFRQKVLKKSKRLRNPEQNGWKVSNANAIISSNGLLASENANTRFGQNVFAKKGFPISGELPRMDNFPGTVLYYFEITLRSLYRIMLVGLSSGNIQTFVGFSSNSYATQGGCDLCWLSEQRHRFEWPNGAIKPEWNGLGDVIGCGLLLNPENKMSIFFTANGILMGKSIQINPIEDSLYPTVSMYGGYGNVSVEANFGDDLAKPFKYDIDKCPGLNLE